MRNGIWIGGGVVLAVGITTLVMVLSGGEPAPEPKESASPSGETLVQAVAEHSGSAVEVERAVTSRIEERCARAEDVLGTHSLTWAGHAEVTIRFAGAVTPADALRRVGAALEEMREGAPETKLSLSAGPADGLLTYVVAGLVRRDKLSAISRDLSDRLSALAGVEEVHQIGDLRPEVVVTLDAGAVHARSLTPSQVVAAVAEAATALRKLHGDTADGGRRHVGRDLIPGVRDIVLAASAAHPILLRDVARVELAHSRDGGHAVYRGDPAVVVQVTVGADAASRVAAEVQSLSSKLPEEVRVVSWPPVPTSTVVDIEWGLSPGTAVEEALEMWAHLDRVLRDARVEESLVWMDGAEGGRRIEASVHVDRPGAVQAIANAFGRYPGLDVRSVRARGPSGPRSVVLSVGATDQEQLESLAMRIAQSLQALRGILMVAHDAPRLEQRMDLQVDPAKANRLGLSESEVVAQVEFCLGGQRLAPLFGVPILLRLDSKATDLAGITLEIAGASVPLSEVADVSLVSSVGRLHRVDGRRTATITAMLASDAEREVVLRAVRAAVADLALPHGAVRWKDAQTASR